MKKFLWTVASLVGAQVAASCVLELIEQQKKKHKSDKK
jgi:hypothetical protein